MKIEKGNFGYIQNQKKKRLFQMILGILLIAVIFFTGFLIFKTKATYFTVLAVFCIFPFAQVAVNYLMFVKYNTQPQERYAKLTNYLSDSILLLSDIILTRKDSIYNLPFLIINQGNIYAYIELAYEKTDVIDFIKEILIKSGFSSSKIEVFDDFNSFNKKLDELKKIRTSPNSNDVKIKQEILRNSL
ncbi:MAG: hypothetical protein K0R15_472 [Clostridiales bacterium]|jgi:uncharacterized membrane protein SirB2|nr:hypothetical protein [Clostridiales bacterium]